MLITAETRLTDPDFHEQLRWVVDTLNGSGARTGLGHRPSLIHFSAEGSAYDLLLVPFECIVPARPEAPFPIAKGHPDAQPGSLYIVRDAWLLQNGAWKGNSLWGVDVVAEHLCHNLVDALPLTILLAELDIMRFGIERDETVGALYASWILDASTARYQHRITDIPGAWIEYHDGEQVDVGLRVLGFGA